MTQPLDEKLTNAVAQAVGTTPQPKVTFLTICQAICRSQNGGRSCLCDRRVWKHCHATDNYGDMGLEVMNLLKQAKLL